MALVPINNHPKVANDTLTVVRQMQGKGGPRGCFFMGDK
jgi:hypothetical protein